MLYENRHLYTDDVKYNSLIVSNLFNKQIKLLDFDTYALLDDYYKLNLYRIIGKNVYVVVYHYHIIKNYQFIMGMV